MKTELSFAQTRVLGVCLEKEKTTPDQYPLSVNGITTACNQKSNREPVVSFSEIEVQNTVDELIELRLIAQATDITGRVAKYRHRFSGSQFAAFSFNPQQTAIIAILFLRGPQTPGELRTRTQRLYPFKDVNAVESALDELASDENTAYVVKLPREAGKRESRYAHLFSGEVEISSQPNVSHLSSDGNAKDERIAELEARVDQLSAELQKIKDALDIE
ncbi:YceH family protein [Algibacillus agarilyticus]|uniref:YceH family protein n=1 Tax=Algibacillus agarilyticus TaxID=2234133 RepID=UPI000DD07D09|nr:DUF480 domain-containing protein [Algibacillus agarilyticus]